MTAFLHNCHCGAWGAYGYTRTTVEAATWYCREHRPDWTPNREFLPGTRPIPERFAAPCAFCQNPVDTRTPGTFRWTSGWVMQRAGGGGNAVAMPRRENYWAHKSCVERASSGRGERTLFDAEPNPPERKKNSGEIS